MKSTALKRQLKIAFSALLYARDIDDPHDIAEIVDTTPERVLKWMNSPYWRDALDLWEYKPNVDDLGLVQNLWEHLIQTDQHISPTPELLSVINDDVLYALQSSVCCYEGLTEPQIQQRLDADLNQHESDPIMKVMFDNRWWLYPNFDECVYSKVFARANIAADLVVGTGSNTHFVCIQDGKLALTQEIGDHVVQATDARLLVCL